MNPGEAPRHAERTHRYLRVAGKRTLRALQSTVHLEHVPGELGRMVGRTLDLLPLDADLLTSQGADRSRRLNRQLAWSMAFIAGAVNAGGFLALKTYTSHISGTISRMADELALGRMRLFWGALEIALSFMAGAFTAGFAINLGRRMRLRSHYALSLLLEAALMLVFGLMGATLHRHREFFQPATVVLLSFMMGMHNSVVTTISNAEVRTTHMTGNATDFGIELSRLFYPNILSRRGVDPIRANRQKLLLHGLTLVSFFGGGVVGAVGFRHIGFKITVFFAAFLFLLAVRPIVHDLRVRIRVMGGLPDRQTLWNLVRRMIFLGS